MGQLDGIISSTELGQLKQNETPLSNSSASSNELPASEEVVPASSCSSTEDGSPISNSDEQVSEAPQACHNSETVPLPECSSTECAAEAEIKRARNWTMSDIKQHWRKFNIDLMPKVLHIIIFGECQL